jgi:ABC-type multidrug transport system fused ATPase/permease subunit
LVVAEEPELAVTAPIEVATTAAVRNLADTGTLVVVLPKRLTTLRSADQVVLVHNHSILDIGTHSELLMRSELYRHLNSLRFSPLRDIGPEQ